ncbi:GNAT family N-acetyltransferase [Paenibacillus favisporus]|uniref:GNAT family N-acetyltransferase n=1 Tax=Paenibacillus TaxID=44249 RepID=UPI00190C272E|nr:MULTISPECIES: GNAT family N-acetyltransferase [Paenibacillus]MBJ9991174.1 GNAT family N-acetyltransferase [Paenibacillus sp. S28]MEC0175846.1 GNAT family N-acetyltransferase [Paenibacillus favisporus]
MLNEDTRTPTPLLTGSRLMMKPIEPQDAPRLLDILADPQVIKYVTQSSFFSFARSRRIASELLSTGRRDSLHMGIWLHGERELAGVVSMQHWREEKRDAMIGYMLAKAYWGRGIATEALGLMLNYAFTELKLLHIEGRCHAVNTASARVMQKNGMQLSRTFQHRRMFFAAPVEMMVYAHTDRTYDEYRKGLQLQVNQENAPNLQSYEIR